MSLTTFYFPILGGHFLFKPRILMFYLLFAINHNSIWCFHIKKVFLKHTFQSTLVSKLLNKEEVFKMYTNGIICLHTMRNLSLFINALCALLFYMQSLRNYYGGMELTFWYFGELMWCITWKKFNWIYFWIKFLFLYNIMTGFPKIKRRVFLF